MSNNCSSCRYYRGTSIGHCLRFPQAVKVAAAYWCGEYAAVDLPKVEPIVSKKGKSRLNLRPLPPEDGDQL
jgi:hypothetical protein